MAADAGGRSNQNQDLDAQVEAWLEEWKRL